MGGQRPYDDSEPAHTGAGVQEYGNRRQQFGKRPAVQRSVRLRAIQSVALSAERLSENVEGNRPAGVERRAELSTERLYHRQRRQAVRPCKKASGPDNGGAVDPVSDAAGDGTTWQRSLPKFAPQFAIENKELGIICIALYSYT